MWNFTMEFCSATKKNEILSFAGKWMELESIKLSEVTQGLTELRMMKWGIYPLVSLWV
jgi:hypothetical protein